MLIESIASNDERIEVVREWPGRSRISVKGLRDNRQMATFLTEAFGDGPDCMALADWRTGRVLFVKKGQPTADAGWNEEVKLRLNTALSQYREWMTAAIPDQERLEKIITSGGLSTDEASQSLAQIGPNELPLPRNQGWRDIIAQQVQDRMTLLLLFAALGSLALKRRIDAFAILSVLLISAGVAIWQESQIRKEDEGLKILEASVAHVKRDGIKQVLPARELVPGDVVFLEAGDAVPADGYLLQANRLQVDESTLTGEAVPVMKAPDVAGTVTLFMGTTVVGGTAKMIVISTGAHTYLGKMASELYRNKHDLTPLQKNLQQLSRKFSLFIAIWVGMTAAIALIRGHTLTEVLMTNLTMYISAIPEGLPLLLLVAQVYTARKVHRSVLQVRRLQSLEALAATTVWCADKTGTLTRNEMTVLEKWETSLNDELFPSLLECAVLCNNVDVNEKNGIGDPLEIALIRYAIGQGVNVNQTTLNYRRMAEEPFDSATRRMTVVVEYVDGQKWLIVKGAPETVLSYCESAKGESVDGVLSDLERQAEESAYKIIAFAVRSLVHDEDENNFSGLLTKMKYLGSLGLVDPPRMEAMESVERLQQEGIKVAMLTGDHPATATAVGRRIKLQQDPSLKVLTGDEVDRLSASELQKAVGTTAIFARLTPMQKVKVVQAMKDNGEVVAMTGDGVNDALAIRHADVGIAMGSQGSEVAKRSSSLWLMGDDLGNFVKGYREGRHMLAKMERAIGYLLSGNISEVIFMSSCVWLGWPIAFNPTQILLINILTDSVPTFILLTHSQAEYPFGKGGRLFGRLFWRQIMVRSVTMGVVSLGIYRLGIGLYQNASTARTMALFSVITSQMSQLESWRSDTGQSIVPKGKWLRGTVTGTMLVLLASIYLPGMQRIFGTRALPTSGILLSTLGATLVGKIANLTLKKEDIHAGEFAPSTE